MSQTYRAVPANWKTLAREYKFDEDGKRKNHKVFSFDVFYEHDEHFRRLYEQVHGVTQAPAERAWGLYQLAKFVTNMPGIVVEVGIFRGGTAKLLTLLLPGRNFYFYDTFEGIPTVDEEHDSPKLLQQFANTKMDAAMQFVGPGPNIHFVKGVFPATYTLQEPISFIHIDVDTYITVKAVLNAVYPFILLGGVIVIDDYGLLYPGVKEAADEFFSNKAENPVQFIPEQAFVIRGK